MRLHQPSAVAFFRSSALSLHYSLISKWGYQIPLQHFQLTGSSLGRPFKYHRLLHSPKKSSRYLVSDWKGHKAAARRAIWWAQLETKYGIWFFLPTILCSWKSLNHLHIPKLLMFEIRWQIFCRHKVQMGKMLKWHDTRNYISAITLGVLFDRVSIVI